MLFKIGTAECKILILFLYYVILIIFATVGFVLNTRNAAKYDEEILQYFLCEATPIPGQPCARGYRQYSHPFTVKVSVLLLEIVPMLNLVFVIDTKMVNRLFHQLKKIITKYQKPSTESDDQQFSTSTTNN